MKNTNILTQLNVLVNKYLYIQATKQIRLIHNYKLKNKREYKQGNQNTEKDTKAL